MDLKVLGVLIDFSYYKWFMLFLTVFWFIWKFCNNDIIDVFMLGILYLLFFGFF